jgi:nitrate reductase gamma subunit
MSILHILSFSAILIFLGTFIYKILKISSAPVHLRWELYPVPHEKGKAHYGGLKMGGGDWGTKNHKKDMLGEGKSMASEIVFLKGVWEHNKNLWTGSFPFHFALYIYIVDILLMIFSAVLEISGINVTVAISGFPFYLHYFTIILLWAGAIIGTIGSIRMFFLRLTDKNLSLYATASHFFNIILIGAVYISNLIWLIFDGNVVSEIISFHKGLLTLSNINDFPVAGYVNLYLSLFFIAYFPFTHMSHFLTKYFTYHHIRWDDKENMPGTKLADKIAAHLNQPVTWSAPHIGADGKKTWLAIAQSPVPKDVTSSKMKKN